MDDTVMEAVHESFTSFASVTGLGIALMCHNMLSGGDQVDLINNSTAILDAWKMSVCSKIDNPTLGPAFSEYADNVMRQWRAQWGLPDISIVKSGLELIK